MASDRGVIQISWALAKRLRESLRRQPMVRGESKAAAAVREWFSEQDRLRTNGPLQYPDLPAQIATKVLRDARGR